MKMELRESEARALVSFAYDPFGRRIKKVSSAGTSIYAYDGDNLVEETNSSGGVDLPPDSAHGIIRHRDFLNS